MIFLFLQYIQPGNYLNIVKQDGSTVFPDPNYLPKSVLSQLAVDQEYQTAIAQDRDLSWQAIQKGYIGTDKTLIFREKLPLVDEYHFVRKNFRKIWSYYILFLRLITFHNPIKEIMAFWQTKNIKRVNVYASPLPLTGWNNFSSENLSSQPKVCVIIPTLNRYQYLRDVMHDLEKQDYTNFSVIVVDQSEPFQPSFYGDFRLDIKVIYQAEKAICLARDTAIIASDAEYLLFFDDDSRVEADWISNHLKCLDFFNASISSGTSLARLGAKVPESYYHFKLSTQIDTGNVMIKKEVFRQIGLFDRQLEKIGLEDAELGLRALKAGFVNISNPYSRRIHLKANTGGFREIGMWDGLRHTSWFAPRPSPSMVYISRSYFGNKQTILNLIIDIPLSLIPYKFKGNSKILIFGYILFFVFSPVVMLQVIKSWQIASRKIREGARIERLS